MSESDGQGNKKGRRNFDQNQANMSHRDSSCPANCILHPLPAEVEDEMEDEDGLDGLESGASEAVKGPDSKHDEAGGRAEEREVAGDEQVEVANLAKESSTSAASASVEVAAGPGALCDACTLIGINQQNSQRPDDTDSFAPRVRSDKKSVTMLLGKK